MLLRKRNEVAEELHAGSRFGRDGRNGAVVREMRCYARPLWRRTGAVAFGILPRMTGPSIWNYGKFVLGCGTFGGIGGSPKLLGRGLDEPAAFATMDEAVGLGITLFDSAERYARGASETMIGRWLVERDSAITARVRLATKVAPPGLDGPGGRFDAAFLEKKFSGSLDRLGVETVEFLLTHAPDDDTPIEETLEGLEGIRASGRCRYLGACNVDGSQLTAALEAAERLGISGYQVVQNSYSLLGPQDDRAVRSICAERSLAFTPYSPLAGGALTGKYQRDAAPPPDSRMALRPDGVDELLTPAVYDAIDRLRLQAERRHGVECGALALAWLLHHREVTAVVTGPARGSPHLELAARAGGVVLSDADFAEIESWFPSSAASQ
jgi:aryl-alcohol dehydrogenase-like predicted oxidoreductase